MKKAGNDACSAEGNGEFVSTHDMLAAFGWLLMREVSQILHQILQHVVKKNPDLPLAQVSGRKDWGHNSIVNLRGRSGVPNWAANMRMGAVPPPGSLAVDAVADTAANAVEPPVENGLMGNAIAGSAVQAPQAKGDGSHTLAEHCVAGLAVRRGLEILYSELPARLSHSQAGRPKAAGT